jgi:hypothetical protein
MVISGRCCVLLPCTHNVTRTRTRPPTPTPTAHTDNTQHQHAQPQNPCLVTV